MNEYELCVNLWYCFDKQTGFVNAIVGRGYYLQGSDEQKTNILKSLSGADFLCIEWQPVPEHFQATIVNVQSHDQETFSGFVHVSDIDIHGFALFEEVLKAIEGVHQRYLPIKNTAELKVPDEPLYVMTAVEYSEGKYIKAINA